MALVARWRSRPVFASGSLVGAVCLFGPISGSLLGGVGGRDGRVTALPLWQPRRMSASLFVHFYWFGLGAAVGAVLALRIDAARRAAELARRRAAVLAEVGPMVVRSIERNGRQLHTLASIADEIEKWVIYERREVADAIRATLDVEVEAGRIEARTEDMESFASAIILYRRIDRTEET